MNNFLSVLASPREAFESILERPRWLLPTFLCVVTLFMVVWLGSCWYDFSSALSWGKLLGPALISPLIVGIVVLGSSLFLYLTNLIVPGQTTRSARFKTMVSLNVHCGIVFVLGEIVNFLLVRSNLLGERGFSLPNRFPTGLDLLLLGVDDPNLYLTIILHCTSIFVVWYLLVLSFGIRELTGSSRARSFIVVGALWLAASMTAVGIAYAAGGSTTIRVTL